jgi:hypothetical protein
VVVSFLRCGSTYRQRLDFAVDWNFSKRLEVIR